MGVLSRIFGSDKAVGKAFDLIDDIWETGEEKAQSKIALLNAYAPFKLAQRYIAFSFTGVFLLCFVLVLGMTLAGKGQPDDILAVMEQFRIGWVMTTIVLFYFGGGLVDSVKRNGDGSK